MIQLKLANAIHSYWQSITITRSLEQMSGEFQLGLTLSTGDETPTIVDNERCQVLLHGLPVIDGHIEKITPSFDDESTSLSVSGRDITADLVDASAIVDKQELHNVTIAAAASALLAETSITVNCPEPGTPFEKFAINDGESIFDTLKSHAEQRGFLLFTQADGTLHIGKPTAEQSNHKLQEGINTLSVQSERDYSKLYNKYIVKAQGKGGKSTTATAIDETVRPGRNLIVHAERNENSSLTTQQRAEWEKQSRRAASLRITVKVAGWLASSKKLWDINMLIHLDAPSIDIKQYLLVAAVEYSINDEQGSQTTLTLVDPDTYAKG